MVPSLLITFRETLEIALIVGIVLGFLMRINNSMFKKIVWYGVLVGILFAAIVALLIEILFGGLTGQSADIFEGLLMFVTAGFITWMILWAHRQKHTVAKIKKHLPAHVENNYGFGIAILVASSVFREGTETALYLKATSLTGLGNQIFGAVLGFLLALFLGVLILKWAMEVDLKKVFTITSVFLLLFAAGLVAHGVAEFQGIGLLPVFSFDPVINLSSVLDHEGMLGSFLGTLFGYTSKPTMFEAIAYLSYIGFILLLKRMTDQVLVVRQSK